MHTPAFTRVHTGHTKRLEHLNSDRVGVRETDCSICACLPQLVIATEGLETAPSSKLPCYAPIVSIAIVGGVKCACV